MAHCFAIGTLLGRPGAPEIVDHALEFIWNRHRDPQAGGYFWSVNDAGATPAVVTLRLEQAAREFLGEGA